MTETYIEQEINEGDDNVATLINEENEAYYNNENTMDKTSNNYENEIQTEASNSINNENTMDANTNGCSLASSDNNQRYYLFLFLHLL